VLPSLLATFEDASLNKFLYLNFSKFGELAFNSLAPLLTSDNEMIRIHAIMALGTLKEKEAVPLLINALLDNSTRVRNSAIIALGTLGDTSASSPILTVITPQYLVENPFLIKALGQLGSKKFFPIIIETLNMVFQYQDVDDQSSYIVEESLNALGLLGVNQLAVQALFYEESNVKVLCSLEFLTNISAVDYLIIQLEKATQNSPLEDSSIQTIIEALGNLGDRRAIDILLTLLDEYPQTVIRALGQIGDFDIFDTLVQWLANSDDDIRATVILALGNLKNNVVVEPIIQKLEKDESIFVRECAANTLGRHKYTSAVIPLITALSDSAPRVRIAAAKSLAILADTRALTRLEELATNDSTRLATGEAVWVAALEAIDRLTY
jgi:HEAT repeat protein